MTLVDGQQHEHAPPDQRGQCWLPSACRVREQCASRTRILRRQFVQMNDHHVAQADTGHNAARAIGVP
jgi:hypothetical protein